MDALLDRPELVAGVGAAVVSLLVALLLVGAAVLPAGQWVVRRVRGPDRFARELLAAGWVQEQQSWYRVKNGLKVTFTEVPGGVRWAVRLPGYQAVQLTLTPRGPKGRPTGGTFLSGDDDLDGAFVFAADRTAPALQLLATEGLPERLLALRSSTVRLTGDEVIVETACAPGWRPPKTAFDAVEALAAATSPRSPACP